jgi:hypothetical protein
MSKATLHCVGFKPVCRGSLRGFASIAFDNLKMVVHGISIHVANGASWASPPAQPLIREGQAVKDDRGRSRTAHRCLNSEAPVSGRPGPTP